MIARHASCSCGQLRIETSGEPLRISVCHCLACQKRTGSAFGVCPDCGSTVHWQLAQFPDVIAIAVGAFADPAFPARKFSVYEERQHKWVELVGQIEHID